LKLQSLGGKGKKKDADVESVDLLSFDEKKPADYTQLPDAKNENNVV
jgi:hypothetical protein